MGNVIDLDIRDAVSIIHFEILTPRAAFGEELSFTFTLQNISQQPVRLDIRYEITHPGRDGASVRRMYKLSSRKCPAGFLLCNHSHLLQDDIASPGTSPHEALLDTCSTFLPCELGIVINGLRLKSKEFYVFRRKC